MAELKFDMNTPMSKELPDLYCKRENVFTGTIGALLGALIGGVSIVLLADFGILAAISGWILAICTLKGYELLGGRLGVAGIVICCALMLLTPYIADRVFLTFFLIRELDAGISAFSQIFTMIPNLIGNGIETAAYIKDLVMLYIFVAIGASGTLRNALKKD